MKVQIFILKIYMYLFKCHKRNNALWQATKINSALKSITHNSINSSSKSNRETVAVATAATLHDQALFTQTKTGLIFSFILIRR